MNGDCLLQSLAVLLEGSKSDYTALESRDQCIRTVSVLFICEGRQQFLCQNLFFNSNMLDTGHLIIFCVWPDSVTK